MSQVARGRDPQHWFRAYQLVFAASIPIPEMISIEGDPRPEYPPDVVITEDDFPDHLPDALESSAVHEVNAQALLLRVAGVGRYLVREGREILIDPDPDATAHDVRVYLLGTCLGVLLHQRGLLILHASGIVTDQGALLFAGASGAGKSTLLGELLRRGNKMIVDDVCAIRFDESRPIVIPAYPRTRLWADAAARFDVDTANLPRTRSSWDKFERQVPDQFWNHEAALTHVFHLADPHDGEEFLLEPLAPVEAFKTLVDHTYRGILLDGLDLRASHFELASRAASSVKVIRVRRPAGTYRLEELADLVLGSLQSP